MTESRQSSAVPWAGIIVFAIVAMVIGALLMVSSDDDGIDTAPDSLNLARIAELKNLGIAYLENNDLAGAESCFDELTSLLPDDRFGWQNLAITRVLKIAPENINRAEDQAAFDAGHERLDWVPGDDATSPHPEP